MKWGTLGVVGEDSLGAARRTSLCIQEAWELAGGHDVAGGEVGWGCVLGDIRGAGAAAFSSLFGMRKPARVSCKRRIRKVWEGFGQEKLVFSVSHLYFRV